MQRTIESAIKPSDKGKFKNKQQNTFWVIAFYCLMVLRKSSICIWAWVLPDLAAAVCIDSKGKTAR